jgi:tRNA modification GTPase
MTTLGGVRWLLRQARLLPAALTELLNADWSEEVRTTCRRFAARKRVFDWYATPLRVALVGPPNAGKSTLANALAEHPFAIVSPTPGTTRDWLEIPAELDGFPAVWLDTAGLRRTADSLEAESIRRTRLVMAQAGAVVFVLDGTPEAGDARSGFIQEYVDAQPTCVVLNKADCGPPDAELISRLAVQWGCPVCVISAEQRRGISELRATLVQALGRGTPMESAAAFSGRQVRGLNEAARSGNRNGFKEKILQLISAAIKL